MSLQPILLSLNHTKFCSTKLFTYHHAFFPFMFLQRLKILTVASGVHKYNLLQEIQVASIYDSSEANRHVYLGSGRQVPLDQNGWRQACHGSEAARTVSKISSGYKRPMKCCLLKCRSHKIIHSSLVFLGSAVLSFAPGPQMSPSFYCLNRKIMVPWGGKSWVWA